LTSCHDIWRGLVFYTTIIDRDIGWGEGATWQFIGLNSLVGGHTRSANVHKHDPFINTNLIIIHSLPIVCSYVHILESVIIIPNYSRDVFCPKLATLTVSIVTFQKTVLKICSQWCSQSNPNWWCLCIFFPPQCQVLKNDVDDISETPLMNFLVVEFVT
jgi:hypothetical protein